MERFKQTASIAGRIERYANFALKLPVVMAGMLVCTTSFSLGLGSLEVKSHLEQPLDGRISIDLEPGESLNDARITLASEEEYQRLGIDYPAYLEKLSLIKDNIEGANVLRLSSNDDIIQEPFIQVLVRVEWSGGSFLREYTALIDPPLYNPSSQSTVELVSQGLSDQTYQGAGEAANLEVSSQAMTSTEGSGSPSAVNSDSYSGNVDDGNTNYGPVKAGQSLSLIANELQQRFPGLSIYQLMQAIYKQNGRAFIDGNINRLAKDVVLKIDGLAMVRNSDSASARQFVFQQINRSKDNALADSAVADSSEVAVSVESAPSSLEPELIKPDTNRFQVASGEGLDAGLVATTDSEPVTSTNNSDLTTQQQVTQLQASLTSKELENLALKERVDKLERQFADLSRLANLEVQSNELANLESRLAEQNTSDVQPTSNLTTLNSVVERIPENDKPGATAVGDISGESELEVVSDEQSTKLAHQPSTGFLANALAVLHNNPLLSILGLLVVMLLAGFSWQRARADDDLVFSFQQGVADGGAQPDTDTSFVTVYDEDKSTLQSAHVDAIAEADVYIAYGREEHAETVLLTGIKNNPEQIDIKQKLLGLYHKNKNIEGFRRVAAGLYSQKHQLTPEIWANVCLLGKQLLPDDSLFIKSFNDTSRSSASLSAAAKIGNQPADLESNSDDFNAANLPADEDGIAVDEHSFYLVNFDDGHSEISELDEVKLDSLGFDIESMEKTKSEPAAENSQDDDANLTYEGVDHSEEPDRQINFENKDIEEQSSMLLFDSDEFDLDSEDSDLDKS